MIRFPRTTAALFFILSAASALAQTQRAGIVLVTGFDFAFTAPDTIPSGATTFRFTDKGKVPHHLIVFRLAPGTSLSDFHRKMSDGGASPPGIASMAGLQSDRRRQTPPGASAAAHRQSEVTMVMTPGRYVLACLHDDDGMTHLQKGMMRELTVVAARSPRPAPRADATLTMSDYAYSLSRPLTQGVRTIRLANTGPQEHHVFIQRMVPGTKLSDIAAHRAARAKERAAGVPDSLSKLKPPQIPVIGLTRMSPGEVAFVTLSLQRGDYRLFCLVPDTRDGKPHTAHGMDQVITVQ